MKKWIWLAALAAASAALVVSGCSSAAPSSTTPAASTTPASGGAQGSSTTAPAAIAVNIANFAFAPADVTVKVGQTVTWTNNDQMAHTVTGSTFDSGQIAPGATFSFTFAKAGTYDYKCSIHPSMTAKVTVQ